MSDARFSQAIRKGMRGITGDWKGAQPIARTTIAKGPHPNATSFDEEPPAPSDFVETFTVADETLGDLSPWQFDLPWYGSITSNFNEGDVVIDGGAPAVTFDGAAANSERGAYWMQMRTSISSVDMFTEATIRDIATLGSSTGQDTTQAFGVGIRMETPVTPFFVHQYPGGVYFVVQRVLGFHSDAWAMGIMAVFSGENPDSLCTDNFTTEGAMVEDGWGLPAGGTTTHLVDGGTWTAATITAGDVLKLGAVGDDYYAYINGSLVLGPTTFSDGAMNATAAKGGLVQFQYHTGNDQWANRGCQMDDVTIGLFTP